MNTKQSDTMYIICECALREEDITTDVLNENTVETATGEKIKTVTIDTTLQSFEVKNWNRRIYGGALVMDAIDNDGMIQNDIKHGQWIGEYGHPLDTSPKRQLILNPPTSSHRILNYRREGNLLKGHVQTLADGLGTMMANRILQGMPAAFSLRSLGSVDLATGRVKAPLKVITYDSVYRPSHIEAYQDSILTECAGFTFTSENMPGLLTESSVMIPINESIDQLSQYAAERSTNAKLVADMFNLDKLNCVLQENGTRMCINIDDDTNVNIPVESFITMQYSDILNNGSKILKKGV